MIWIYLSYAFSIWMLVDAYKRGESCLWWGVILFPFGEWIYFFVVKIHDFEFGRMFSRPGADLKCSTCKYCGSLYQDRAQCRFGKEPLIKTRVHINYCQDYVPK